MWTEAQADAIRTSDSPLLVSAAAGSGKTSVLAERCVHLVCDAPDPCNIDELLVVTFTNAAADEMRHRIEHAIRTRVERSDDPRLRRQPMLMPRASISTLHGFCSQLVRTHFSRLGIDPAVRLLDEKESALLRLDVARRLIADRFDAGNDAVAALVTRYCRGQDIDLVRLIDRLDGLLASVIDRDAWLDRAMHRLEEATQPDIDHSELGRAWLGLVHGLLDELQREGRAIASAMRDEPGLERYLPAVAEPLERLEMIARAATTIDGVREAAGDLTLARLPVVKCTTQAQLVLKDRLSKWRDDVKRRIPKRLGRFTSEERRQGMRDAVVAAHDLIDLAREFDARYTREKHALRAMDFADLERFTLRLLRNDDDTPTEVALHCQRRFRHVLVDEYQDINELQDELLRYLSTEWQAASGQSTSNLYCVGDVKQSIYRFRLADPTRFLDRLQRLSTPGSGRVIRLQQNFRTRAPLLESINAVFERLMIRETSGIAYDATHRLNAGAAFLTSPQSPSGAPIDLWIVDRPDRKQGSEPADDDEDDESLEAIEKEARVVGDRIRKWVGVDGATPLMVNAGRGDDRHVRPAQFGDVAILLRSPKRKERLFARVLQSMGVPVVSEGRDGFFAAQEIRDVRALLDVLVNRRQDIPLAAVLTGPIANLDDPESALATIRIAYPPGPTALPFHLAVQAYASQQSNALAHRLQHVLQTIDRWRTLASQRPVAELLGVIFDESALPTIVSAMPGGKQRFANLMLLHDLARQFGAFQRQGLARFTEFLDNLEEDADFGPATIAETAGNAVRMMSIHRSKGLEFPIVVIADLGKQFNTQSLKEAILLDRDVGIAPTLVDEPRRARFSSLASVVAKQQIGDQQMAEEIRVLYVAMTRAKEKLVLVGSSSGASLEVAQRDWTGHIGPLPAGKVLSARTMLDWLLPIAATVGDAVIDARLVTIPDTPETARQTPAHRRAAAQLKPLPHTPSALARAQASLAAIEFVYPHRDVASRPAATSVTSIVKPQPPPDLVQTERDEVLESEFVLPMPTFLSTAAPTGADRGTATHLLLQHLDFTSSDTLAAIAAQVQRLVDRRVLDARLAAEIDLDAVLWFVSTDLARQFARSPSRLHRELSLLVREPAEGAGDTLADRRMIRGRIDALLDDPAGLTLIDYKTDRVTGTRLLERIELYRGQIHAYADAMQRIAGKPVRSAMLAFLHSRQLIDVLADTQRG